MSDSPNWSISDRVSPPCPQLRGLRFCLDVSWSEFYKRERETETETERERERDRERERGER